MKVTGTTKTNKVFSINFESGESLETIDEMMTMLVMEQSCSFQNYSEFDCQHAENEVPWARAWGLRSESYLLNKSKM
jgi:hypothetical protein